MYGEKDGFAFTRQLPFDMCTDDVWDRFALPSKSSSDTFS